MGDSPAPRVDSERVSPSKSSGSGGMSKSDFEVISLVGYGQAGTVVQLVKSRESGMFFAMKTIEKWALIEQRNSGDPKAIDRASAERDLHVSLMAVNDCPYFVKFFYSFQSSRNLYYILEYCPCDVLEYVNQFGPLSVDEALIFIAELAVAVDHLHRSGAIHRDIKSDNILISTTGHVRLSDFGSSKQFESDERRCDSIIGFSLAIMPPEFFTGSPSYGSAIDWFQVGICAFEALTGRAPFSSGPLKSVDSADYPPQWPEAVEKDYPEIVDLVNGLLHPDEQQRTRTLEEIIKHPACSSLDWPAITAGTADACPFARLDGHVPFVTPRMRSSISSDFEFDPLPFKSFSFIRK